MSQQHKVTLDRAKALKIQPLTAAEIEIFVPLAEKVRANAQAYRTLCGDPASFIAIGDETQFYALNESYDNIDSSLGNYSDILAEKLQVTLKTLISELEKQKKFDIAHKVESQRRRYLAAVKGLKEVGLTPEDVTDDRTIKA